MESKTISEQYADYLMEGKEMSMETETKLTYETPWMELVMFETEDIITTSGFGFRGVDDLLEE